jgi:hypothetical protein
MEYDVSMSLLMQRITMITLEELRADLQYEYDQLQSRKNGSGNNNNNNNNSNKEHALFAGGGGFKETKW